MHHLALKHRGEPARQEYGVITEAEKVSYTVATDSGTWRAKQAASCLVRPLVGDRVFVSVDAENGCYVLAILEREGACSCQLSFDGDVEVRVSGGRFRLASQGGVDLASAGDISLVSPELKIHADRGEASVDRLFFFGSFLHAQLARIRLMAGALDSVVERLCQKVKRCYRDIEESEHVKAGSLDYRVKTMLSLKGKYSVFTAKEDVKIDAERIHIG